MPSALHKSDCCSAISAAQLSENYSATSVFTRGMLQGWEKEHKPKLLNPDIFRWGRGLPHEGVGAKKFGMSLETQGKSGQDIPGFCRDIPGVPENLRKKNICVQFSPPTLRHVPYKTSQNSGRSDDKTNS